MSIDFSEVIRLKKAVAKMFDDKIHFHDSCGGQYFSLEQKNDRLQNFIAAYFADKNINSVFSNDGCIFTLEEF